MCASSPPQYLCNIALYLFESRNFLRKDNFVQHIKGTHLKHVPLAKPIPDELLDSCFRFNPLPQEVLYCGICNRTFAGWPSRQAHVARHMITGKFDKSSRLSYPRPPLRDPGLSSSSTCLEEGSRARLNMYPRSRIFWSMGAKELGAGDDCSAAMQSYLNSGRELGMCDVYHVILEEGIT
jgi:hypothetical protein